MSSVSDRQCDESRAQPELEQPDDPIDDLEPDREDAAQVRGGFTPVPIPRPR